MTKILLVDDDPLNLKLIVEILHSMDFTIHTAKDGFEALTMTDKDMYDLIFMDIELPGMDGIETSRRIKAKSGYNKTPIIALTAFTMKGDKEKFLDAGLDHYIAKPIHFTDFINLVEEIVKKRDNELE
jgi:CheY-like chemotaxis protein